MIDLIGLSINSNYINDTKELRSIINFNKEGKWLVLLENQIGAELPWALIKQSEAKDIIFLEG